MFAHQAILRRLPAGLLARFGQGLNEVMPVHVVQEDVVPLVATAHDVIHRSWILDSKLARHSGALDPSSLLVNAKSVTFLRSDPSPISDFKGRDSTVWDRAGGN